MKRVNKNKILKEMKYKKEIYFNYNYNIINI
jgi:hypothetical protein